MNGRLISVSIAVDSSILAFSAPSFRRWSAIRSLRQVDAVALLELGREPLDDAIVEVVAAEVRVAVGRLHLDDALADLEHRDVERAAAEVVDGDRFVLLLVEAVGERRGRRLVDDAQHVQAGNLAGVLRRLPLRVVEVRRHGDDRVGDLSRRGSPRRPASASAAPSRRFRAASISCRAPRPRRRRSARATTL